MNAADYQKWAIKHGLVDNSGDWPYESFKAFWEVFPHKTPGGRVLRALSLTAKTADLAFALFKRGIRSPEEADLAIRGLKLELINRRTNNGLEYINNIQTYIRNKNWELYQDSTESIDENSLDIDMEEGSSFDII
jgi:hypothetical protein